MMMNSLALRSRFGVLALCLAVLLLGGCASRPVNPDDPLERYNRAMFGFNDGLDKAVIRPAARIYDAVTPEPVQTGVGNFFSNLSDIWIGLNNLLQGKITSGLSDWTRFAVNSTLGVVGLFDVASGLDLTKHDEDFGQTLGVWGVGEGPYFVVPFFGPRTLRDALVLPLDLKGDMVWTIDHVQTRNSLTALRLADLRARQLGMEKTLEEGSLDKYDFARDFYLQRRRYAVHDGGPPLEYEDYEDYDSADGEAQAPSR